ncbi:MAG: HlyD family secretion protein [Phycisphaerales bacterium]|jgi:HlyD family secretion protein
MPEAGSKNSRPRGIVVKMLVPVLAVGGIGAASAVMMTGGEGTSAFVTTSDVGTASQGSFDITTLASGELVAKNSVEIRSKVESSTTVVEVVAEGTRVSEGDLLVRLSSESIENDIAEEELRVIEAASGYEGAKTAEKIQISDNASALLTAETVLTIARLSLEQWREGDVAKTRQSNQLQVEKAEKDLTRLSEKFEQSQMLFGQEFLSKDELDRDEIAFIQAKATLSEAVLDNEVYETYQYVKDKTQNELDVKQAIAKLERVHEENEINLRDKEARTVSNQRQLQMRQERLDKLKAQLEACTVLAPSAGLVVYGTSTESGRWRAQSEGSMAVGNQVRNNDLLLVLPDTSEMVANVKVHESLAGRIRPGQPVSITIEAINAVVHGEIASIGILAESSGWRDPNLREYTVKIALTPSDTSSKIKPTMRCEAKITLGQVEDALVIPLPSVFNEGAVRYVYTPSGSRYVRRPIKTGRMSDTEVEILGGLTSGEQVLLRNPDAGEVLAGPWDAAELEAAGYTVNEEGQVVSSRGRGMRGQPGAKPQDGAMPQTKPGTKPEESAQKPEAASTEKPAQAPAEQPATKRAETDG